MCAGVGEETVKGEQNDAQSEMNTHTEIRNEFLLFTMWEVAPIKKYHFYFFIYIYIYVSIYLFHTWVTVFFWAFVMWYVEKYFYFDIRKKWTQFYRCK